MAARTSMTDQDPNSDDPINLDDRLPVAELVASAQSWMSGALEAWSMDQRQRMATLAPLALEHLGKAALWHKNPVLLVPLNGNSAERSLIDLATRPNLRSPKLATIGLDVVLRRLKEVLGGLSIGNEQQRRIVNVRNGAIHVGSSTPSWHVLVDCLTVSEELLRYLGEDSAALYGNHYANVVTLLDEQRSDIEQRVAAKRTRARRRLIDLEQLGKEALEAAVQQLERAPSTLDRVHSEFEDIDSLCPECNRNGRLFGEVDTEADIDLGVEPDGSSAYFVGWIVAFTPLAFECNVCNLSLHGAQELTAAGLPATRYQINLDDLREDFDPDIFDERYSGLSD